jgi:hypothetical protein
MGDFEDIADWPDFQAWLDQRSAGSHALLPYDDPRRGLDADDLRRVSYYQNNSLVPDLANVRQGLPETQRLGLFRLLIEEQSDATNYVVYRGLRLDAAQSAGQTWSEQTISSWSLFPRTALGIAIPFGRKPHLVLLRDRILDGEASLYVDAYEEEVIRPAVERTVTRCYTGVYRSNHGELTVHVANLGVA